MSPQSILDLKEASSQDTDLLLELMAGFNQEENIAFDLEMYRQRIHTALDLPDLVKMWIITVNSGAAGYAILTFTFSFEFGGLIATINELYIAPEKRGNGLGSAVLARLCQEASRYGATTLGGDVSDKKPWLSAFYQRSGFECYPYRPYYRSLHRPILHRPIQ